MEQQMNMIIRDNYLSIAQKQYAKSDKNEKNKILTELEKRTGMHRKSLIRLLKSRNKNNGERSPGRKKKYDDPELFSVLLEIWKKTNLLCSKRLKAALPLWLPFVGNNKINDKIKKLLEEISPRTIDRLFAQIRSKFKKKGLCTTKPGSMIKRRIPVMTEQWAENRIGFFEADTVAHCGGSTSGQFVYTLNLVDIATGWTIQRAVWGNGQLGVHKAIIDIEETLPFPILGFDSDNGHEFINYHVFHYFRQRKKPIIQTRSRPYKKNDNAHIESKNGSIIRQYLYYDRFDNIKIASLLNDLYSNEFYFFLNFFIPSTKLISKKRIGSKIIKHHDSPKTPFQRLLLSKSISNKIKNDLKTVFDSLNPKILSNTIFNKIAQIQKLATPYVSK